MLTFRVRLGSHKYADETKIHLEYIPFDCLRLRDLKNGIHARCGIQPDDQVILYEGLFDDEEVNDDQTLEEQGFNEDDLDFILTFPPDIKQPFHKFPSQAMSGGQLYDVETTSNIEADTHTDVSKPLMMTEETPTPVDHTFTICGTPSSSTISTVVDTLLPNNTAAQYSEVVTSVRGRVVVTDSTTTLATTSHVVYPFVFRAGGKDMRAMWATELRERLAASVHPVTLGRDTYQSALQLLDDSPQPNTTTPPSAVTWELTVSVSFRPKTSSN